MSTTSSPTIAVYGKGRVGNALVELGHAVTLDTPIFDDADSSFDATDFDIVIPSPGIPPRNRAYAAENTVCELDFAHRYLPSGFKIITITGTDGKSTTSWIAYELLRQEFGEANVFLSGNFEIPLSETVRLIRERKLERGYVVVEISSFMANGIGANPDLLESLPVGERTGPFTPDYTIFTNFETDHVDWHGSVPDYFRAKMNLVHHTRSRVIAQESLETKADGFNLDFPQITRWYGKRADLADRTDGETVTVNGNPGYRLSQTQLKGTFNAMNLLAAICVVDELGVTPEKIASYLPTIAGLSHRLEFVAVKNGVTYVDDSKSTSAQSLKVALESYPPKSLVLIAGGSDKGDSFGHLSDLFREKLRYAVCIGATRETFSALSERSGVEWSYADSMQEAVAKASQIANLGEVVLLSPGCASFGLFKNYLDRAHQFIDAVQSIPDSHDSIRTIPQ